MITLGLPCWTRCSSKSAGEMATSAPSSAARSRAPRDLSTAMTSAPASFAYLQRHVTDTADPHYGHLVPHPDVGPLHRPIGRDSWTKSGAASFVA